jgi:rhodanese-related sulfurtransferase/predicted transcriptional regulator
MGTKTNKPQKQQQKQNLYALFARTAKAMANPHRLELLDLLAQAPRTVEELAQETQMSVANTSQHLQRLKQAQMVTAVREGVYVRYHLAALEVAHLWLKLRAVAEQQLAEVERVLDDYRDRRHEFEAITAEELMARLENGNAILLDTRPPAEYEAGHLPGAISMPWYEVAQRQRELPPDKLVVAYCRGPYCIYADDALAMLAQAGRPVARLEEGVLEWQEAGNPVELEAGANRCAIGLGRVSSEK